MVCLARRRRTPFFVRRQPGDRIAFHKLQIEMLAAHARCDRLGYDGEAQAIHPAIGRIAQRSPVTEVLDDQRRIKSLRFR